MRRLIFATLAFASLATPLVAQAQPGDNRGDRQEFRQDRRELRDDRRDGDRREFRQDSRELRSDRRDFRDDRRDDRPGFRDDRRDDRRDYGRDRFRAGAYAYPRGYGYRSWDRGAFLPRAYWGERFWIGNPSAYRLGFARPGLRWIRVGPDALLISVRTGAVVDVVRGRFY